MLSPLLLCSQPNGGLFSKASQSTRKVSSTRLRPRRQCAVLNCIKYLAKFGYTEEQVYLLLSCIPSDVLNAVCTLVILPLAIDFDRDVVRPPRKTMDKVEVLAQGSIRVLNTNVCLSTEVGAVVEILRKGSPRRYIETPRQCPLYLGQLFSQPSKSATLLAAGRGGKYT